MMSSLVVGRVPQKTHLFCGATTRYPLTMPRTPKQTTPEGYEIPVPKRGEFDANLDELLKAPQPPKRVPGRRQTGPRSPLP
jgi:hypothetical protein